MNNNELLHTHERTLLHTLLRTIPPVLRARDFRLYLEGGQRLTDLWQAGGKAILGHKPPRVIADIKNTAERGLFAPFPHPAERRFLKALAQLFPDTDGSQYGFRIYENESSMLCAIKNAGADIKLSIWRPFMKTGNPRPPFTPILPWALSPPVLAIEKQTEEKFAPGDPVSPFILAAAARAIHDLLAAGENGGRPRYALIAKALAENSGWRRQGVYLIHQEHEKNLFNEENHKKIWLRFLEQGFLYPPSIHDPLILPDALSPGEESKLASLLKEQTALP